MSYNTIDEYISTVILDIAVLNCFIEFNFANMLQTMFKDIKKKLIKRKNRRNFSF